MFIVLNPVVPKLVFKWAREMLAEIKDFSILCDTRICILHHQRRTFQEETTWRQHPESTKKEE